MVQRINYADFQQMWHAGKFIQVIRTDEIDISGRTAAGAEYASTMKGVAFFRGWAGEAREVDPDAAERVEARRERAAARDLRRSVMERCRAAHRETEH